MSTKYEAPHCATSSILLLLHPSSVQIFSLEPSSLTPLTLCSSVNVRDQVSHPHKNWQNYGFVYFKLYIPRQQTGRQKTLDRMVASIPRI
jgi:hypothetical protein